MRYRYYISQPRQRGHSDDPVGSISRVPADQIEALVTHAVRDRLMESGDRSPSPSEQNTVATHVAKVEVRAKQLAVTMKAIEPTPNHDRELAQHDDASTTLDQGEVILIPWTKPPMRKFRDVIQPASASIQRTRPIRAERRAGLIRAIARGRQWLDEIVSGRFTIEGIAVRQKCGVRQINLTLSMAFSRAATGQGRNRRSPAPWHRHCGTPRCTARVVETVSEAWIANASFMIVGTAAAPGNPVAFGVRIVSQNHLHVATLRGWGWCRFRLAC